MSQTRRGRSLKKQKTYEESLKEKFENDKKELENSYQMSLYKYHALKEELVRWSDYIITTRGNKERQFYLLTVHSFSNDPVNLDDYEKELIEEFKEKIFSSMYRCVCFMSHKIQVEFATFIILQVTIAQNWE
jgi:hypothetical protein